MHEQNKSENRRRLLFVAGGTGGHIYPAVAVRDAILKNSENIEIRFVCGSRPLEKELYRRLGINPVVLKISRIRSGAIGKAVSVWNLMKCSIRAAMFLRSWKPHRVVAFGGYVTAPALSACRIFGTPFDLQEQNSIPGRTNLWFSGGADTIYCSFRKAAEIFRERKSSADCLVTGLPLRSGLNGRSDEDETSSCEKFDLDPDLPVLLITGGSQGARNLYRGLLQVLKNLDKDENIPGFQCLWSAGKNNFDWLKQDLDKESLNRITVRLFSYIDDMNAAYAAADVAVSRAGAGSVAELMVHRVPTVFVPLPYAIGNHQKLNAEEAVELDAALIVEEGKDFEERLEHALRTLLKKGERREKMSSAAENFAGKDAAELIAKNLQKKVEISC